MEIIYIVSSMLLLLFVGMFLALRSKEAKATRRHDSATDPMFRRRSVSRNR